MAANQLKLLRVVCGDEDREQIIVDASASIQYIAQSFPGADPEEDVWLCSRIESTGSDFPYLKTVKTYPVGEDAQLASPGIGGADLATLFGD